MRYFLDYLIFYYPVKVFLDTFLVTPYHNDNLAYYESTKKS